MKEPPRRGRRGRRGGAARHRLGRIALGLAGLAGPAGLAGCEDDRLVPRPASGFFDPDVVDFGEVAAGRTSRSVTTFRNTSGGDLFVRSVRFEPQTDAFGAFLTEGGTLNGAQLRPGRAVGVEVRFGPRSEGRFDVTMLIEADDLAIALPIRGAARLERPATPSVTPAEVAFSGVAPGRVAVRSIELRNVGDRAGVLESATVSGPPFEVGGPSGTPAPLPLRLEPGEIAGLEVRYRPTTPEVLHEGRAVLRFDSGEVTEVGLSGRSTTEEGLECPEVRVDFGAVSRGRSATRTVECRPRGAGWTLEDARLAPGSAPYFSLVQPPRRLAPDRLAVDLVFEARGPVGRQLGVVEITGESGETTRLTVTGTITPPAAGEADIELQLTWNTPYSDLDLHLVRAGGAPFVAGEDCYFASKNPDWGVRDEPIDDPFLDRDDREGYGPETISLLDAVESSFDVYVQYHDYSRDRVEPSTVEIGWRLRGGASGRVVQDLLECADWWHVGRIVGGSSPRFEAVDTVSKQHQARAAERCR